MGSLPGVFSTRSVWVADKEVVHLQYDPEILGYQELLSHAAQRECTAAVYTYDERQQKLARAAKLENVISWQDDLETRKVQRAEQKYYLRNSTLAHLPLTEFQAVKINAVLGGELKEEATSFLSPRQRKLLERIQAVLQQTPQSLSGFSFPENQDDLVRYQQQLLEKLDLLDPAE